jgi:hypothetical protein
MLQLGETFYDPTTALVSSQFTVSFNHVLNNPIYLCSLQRKLKIVLSKPLKKIKRKSMFKCYFQCSLIYLNNACRKSFSRRRKYVEAETVAYVNDFNRSFNQKLERAYGAYSVEIKQNLERGTAL